MIQPRRITVSKEAAELIKRYGANYAIHGLLPREELK